jgi:RNA polymerase sigma-70 factor (ECF subfamily)
LELKTNRETTHPVDRLLRQAINNNREALDELFAGYRPQLYNTALRLLGDSGDAEDALQDGLLSAIRNLRGFKGRSQFSTWLTRIVINAALTQRRRRRPKVMTSVDHKIDPEGQPLANRIPGPGPDPEKMYLLQERVQILEQKLRSLPTAYRRVLRLCHVQAMSIKEAAEALGVPVGTLKSQLCRARIRLREEIAEAWPAQGVLQRSRDGAAITRHRPNTKLTERTAGALARGKSTDIRHSCGC